MKESAGRLWSTCVEKRPRGSELVEEKRETSGGCTAEENIFFGGLLCSDCVARRVDLALAETVEAVVPIRQPPSIKGA